MTFTTGALIAAVGAAGVSTAHHGPSNAIAVGTFLLFVATTLAITGWAARRSRTKGEFYAASGRFSGVHNGVAMAGEFSSAAAFLGTPGLMLISAYDIGYFFIGLTLGWTVIVLIVAERLRNLGSFTFADAVSLRLERRPIRVFAAFATLAVSIPYLLSQFVAAGTLVEGLFGLRYVEGVIVTGILVTLYVTFGGMIGTTWVQIFKALLLMGGASLLAIAILARFDFSLPELARAAVAAHPRGNDYLQPGGIYDDFPSALSHILAFVFGTAGLPHILMRFFTVPDARQARHSATIALGIVTVFSAIVFVIGLGAVALLTDHPRYSTGGTSLIGGSNMAAVHVARLLGGEAFFGFVSAVAFATILAVVSGITLSVAATVSHDLYAQAFRRGRADERRELAISRVATVLFGIVGIALAIVFEGQNVAVLAILPLAIAASCTFPILFLAMYWRGLTTRGALAGGYLGMIVAVVGVVLGPTVWVQALGHERPLFPYPYPTVFSLGIAFLAAWLFSTTDRSARAAREIAGFGRQFLRSQLGPEKLPRGELP
jgi:cation/acetate symporter